MTRFDPAEAARRIADAYAASSPIGRMPAECRSSTIDDSYAVQDALLVRLGPGGGWKVGLNAADGLITRAPLLDARIFADDARLDATALMGNGVEVEFAFRLGADLPPRASAYRDDEIRAAIESFVPLVELVGGRFADRAALPPAEQLADASGAAVVLGAPLGDWRDLDFRRIEAELWVDGVRRQAARDAHPAGDPLVLVGWLANHLASRPGSVGLRRGEIVTTGGLAGADPVRGGERVEARYHLDGVRIAGLAFSLDG